MELWREVLDAVDGTVVCTRSSVARIEVPLDSEPDGVTSLGIVLQLSHVADRADVLEVLETRVLVQLVFLGVLDLDADTLTEQLLELVSSLLHGRVIVVRLGRFHFV